MSEHPDQIAGSASLTCAGCSKPLEQGWVLCPFCGTITVPSSTISAIDAYIQNKLTVELAARLKDQSAIVRELADKAEDTLGNRLKRYTIILGIAGAMLAFFGLKPLYETYAQIKPVVDAAELRIQTVTEAIAKVTGEAALVKSAVDRLSSDVDDQTKRVAQKGGEISQKFQSLDTTATALSRRLDAMLKSLETQVAQVTNQVNDLSVRQVYPRLGQKEFVALNGTQWKGITAKGPGEKWLNIVIDATYQPELSPDTVAALIAELKQQGFTPLVGTLGLNGPYGMAFGPFGDPTKSYNKTIVFYFNHNSKQMAEEVSSIVSKILSVEVEQPHFTDPSTLRKDEAFVINNSGIDLQLYLFRPQI